MKERREKERKGNRTCTWGWGELKQGRDSCIRGSPFTMGKLVGSEGKHLRLLEKCEGMDL